MAFGAGIPGGTAFRGQAGLVTASLHEKRDNLMQIRPNINLNTIHIQTYSQIF